MRCLQVAVLILSAWVGWSVQNNRLDHAWPVRLLRWYSGAFLQVGEGGGGGGCGCTQLWFPAECMAWVGTAWNSPAWFVQLVQPQCLIVLRQDVCLHCRECNPCPTTSTALSCTAPQILDIAVLNLFLMALTCHYFDVPSDLKGINAHFPSSAPSESQLGTMAVTAGAGCDRRAATAGPA